MLFQSFKCHIKIYHEFESSQTEVSKTQEVLEQVVLRSLLGWLVVKVYYKILIIHLWFVNRLHICLV